MLQEIEKRDSLEALAFLQAAEGREAAANARWLTWTAHRQEAQEFLHNALDSAKNALAVR